MSGKSKCKILKQIRQQIAAENNIEFVTAECRFQGECAGTCPKCEAEVRYLEQQLQKRRQAGKAVAVAGIAAALIVTASGCVENRTGGAPLPPTATQSQTRPQSDLPTSTLMGDIVLPTESGTASTEPLMGELVPGEPATDESRGKPMEQTAPVIAVSRLRMLIDGPGVTTLVCFHGCPLRCHWCINPFSFAPETKRTQMNARQLYEQVRLDELYFLSTGGGVTFGGGEPLLYPGFLRDFRRICGQEWHLCAETSLSVPWENVEQAAGAIDRFYVDCKDTDPVIYRRYTGQDNALMLSNLEKLLALIGPERITVRVPLIPEFNTEVHQQRSCQRLEAMGIRNFDLFPYQTKQG